MSEWLTGISVAQMRKVDRLMIEVYGVDLLQMMENAGRSLAVLTRLRLGGSVSGARVLVLVGAGNNGGGGLAAARHLTNAGADVRVVLSVPPPLPGAVPERQRAVLQEMGVPGSDIATELGALSVLTGATIILDALIGYGLHTAPREPVASWIRAANAVHADRIALDVPSGLDGTSGKPSDATVQADATLTLAWPKVGLLVPTVQEFVGDLYLADISVPEAVYRAVGVHRGNLFARGPIAHLRRADVGWEPVEALECP